MLNVNLCASTLSEVREAVMELRRKHVSRFPVDVVSYDERPHTVRFIDSRFPTLTNRRDKCLAILDTHETDDKGRRVYRLISRLIQNDKYKSSSEDYHMKKTTDPAKMLKMLREYAKPYNASEIAYKSINYDLQSDQIVWRSAPRANFNDIVGKLTSDDIAEELMHLHSVGVQFRSDKFRRVITEGIELYDEAKRRKHLLAEQVHIFTQPDGSVVATVVESGGKIGLGTWIYPTMEQAPVCIQQQVAMLRLCEQMNYVPEVGRKVSDTTFWVHVNPDDFKAANS